jgi:predicted TIM-barrel fold metal-dependent hydrolase
MIAGHVVVDAVVHPWNLSPQNQNPGAAAQLEAVYAAHKLSSDAAHQEYVLRREEFFTDIAFETIAEAEFVESPVDAAVLHALPNLGFALRHVTDPRRAAGWRNRFPDRLWMYGTVDTPIVATAVAELEYQVKELGIDGLKLYPALYYDGIGKGWRLDGEDYATPLLDAARTLGIRHVAIHKALWLPPAPREAFDVDDMSLPLASYPDMTFEMVHGGAAFLDDTLDLLEAHPNLFMTLETTFSYILAKPRVFAKILGRMIARCGSHRLLFASGNNLAHPAPIVEAFAHYQFPEEYMEEFGLEPLTETDRANILGLNALRLHGTDPEQLLRQVSNDSFAQRRAHSDRKPWSAIRAGGIS